MAGPLASNYINLVSVCLCVCVFAIGVHISGPNCTRFGVGGLTYWKDHEQNGFATGPPCDRCQISEPGKLESV